MENTEKEQSAERLSIIEKIRDYEKKGLFDVDVEDDPPSRELLPDEIEYVKKGLVPRIKTRIAFFLAYRYAARLRKKRKLIINDIIGAKNLKLDTGVILTANHFSPMDSFIMQYAHDESGRQRRKFYRIIREGNYTSFPGFFGFLMRHCNTLPLSSNSATMRKFVRAVDTVLKNGACILIYPEQSMWYNYKKPKPLKIGAFQMAVKSGVPVVPTFITMTDSDIIGDDGFPVQEHTVHIGKPIYPDECLPKKERAEKMMHENFEFNKSVYEKVYGIPLTYEK